MKKMKTWLPLLFAVLALFSAGTADGIADFIEQGNALIDFQPVSLLPEGYTGYQMAIVSDLVDARLTPADSMSPDGRVCYFGLDENECRSFFENAVPISIGPENAILWMKDEQPRSIFVQHGNTIVPMLQAANRGAEDLNGIFRKKWEEKMTSEYDVIDGHARWSPDGRYLFLNEKWKWHVRIDLDDPYLLDTFTGEIFLLETEGQEKKISSDAEIHFVTCGRFSRDGQYFVYNWRGSKAAGDHYLKRYDLRSGALETVWQSTDVVTDFAELENDQWLVWTKGDNGNELALLLPDSGGYRSLKADVEMTAFLNELFPVSDHTVVLYYAPLGNGYQVIRFADHQVESSEFYAIEDISARRLAVISAEELYGKLGEAITYGRNNKVAGGAYVNPYLVAADSISVVENSDSLLIQFAMRRRIPDTWNDRFQRYYGYLLWNLDSLRMTPVCCVTECAVNELADEVISPDSLITRNRHGNEVYQLTERKEPERNWFAIEQDGETLAAGSVYECSTGSYEWTVKNSDIYMTPGGVLTENVEFVDEIGTDSKGYLITVSMESCPSIIRRIPTVLSEEKYRETADKLGKKKTKRYIDSYYTKVEPERLKERADAEELIRKYPEIVENTMYILRDIADDEDTCVLLETLFEEGGYTDEEFEADAANGRVFTKTQKFPVRYRYADDLRERMSRSEALRLAGLCDFINSAIYYRLYHQEEEPPAIRKTENSMVDAVLLNRQGKREDIKPEELIQEQYVIDDHVYHVKIESMKEDGIRKEIQLSVTEVNIKPRQ